MKPKIRDGFDFKKLDCQYLDICNSYDGRVCKYSTPCPLRMEFRNIVENYVAKDGLEHQVGELP